jgi:hypothetical protein
VNNGVLFIYGQCKLGQGFSSMDDLEEMDIGDGVVPRPTYVSARLDVKQKHEIIELLKA